jgi:Uma2 family endonuclease
MTTGQTEEATTTITGQQQCDRPGWVPTWVGGEWDPNPYAYQTEEELMTAGGLHGQILNYLAELLRHVLAARGLMLLTDTFLCYRDERGIKQRIGPDMLLMPFGEPPSSYDLDDLPPPTCLIEVTSPRSRIQDMEQKLPFYLGLGVQTYLVIDAVTASGQPRRRVQLHVWHLVDGLPQKQVPNPDGSLRLPEMEMLIRAEGHQIRFIDLRTGQRLLDAGELEAARQAEAQARERAEHARQRAEQARQAEAQARQQAEAQRDAEAQARQQAEAELARLRAELDRLRGDKLAE